MLDSGQLAALAEMVDAGTLSQQQADAVVNALSARRQAAEPDTGPATGPGIAPQPGWRDRLIEAAGYVGGAFVGVAVVVLIAQKWGHLARAGQLALLGATAVVTAAVGIGIVMATPGRRSGIRGPDRAPRRRLVSLLLVGASTASTGTVVVALGSQNHPLLIASMVGLVTIGLADRYVSSALSEVGAFGWTTVLVFAIGDQFRPRLVTTPGAPYATGPPPRTTFDLLFPLMPMATGLLWALVVSNLLRQRLVAIVLGLGLTFVTAATYLDDSRTRSEGLVVMGLLAALGLWLYLRGSLWPWLAFSIVTLTDFMFQLAGGANQPVIAFLAAGLALLGMSGFGVWRRRRPTA